MFILYLFFFFRFFSLMVNKVDHNRVTLCCDLLISGRCETTDSASRGVPVHAPAFAGTKLYCWWKTHMGVNNLPTGVTRLAITESLVRCLSHQTIEYRVTTHARSNVKFFSKPHGSAPHYNRGRTAALLQQGKPYDRPLSLIHISEPTRPY